MILQPVPTLFVRLAHGAVFLKGLAATVSHAVAALFFIALGYLSGSMQDLHRLAIKDFALAIAAAALIHDEETEARFRLEHARRCLKRDWWLSMQAACRQQLARYRTKLQECNARRVLWLLNWLAARGCLTEGVS